ncbi:MAG: hypothetical protein HY835_01075, partial [Anaerolineae bacterium]|nr:hypothetical protein [Anaerolineae bacterium]
MDTQLLATKLFLPPAREGWVKRARLLDRLTQAYLSGSRLSLICAPAGFGKTTLAVDWVNTLRTPAKNTLVAWLSLDSGDDDLTVFLRYLAGAFQTILPDTGKDMLRALEQSTNRPGYETLLAALINDLARHPEKMTLVLDDYHVLEQAEIHQALAFFIERAPSQVHFVITTRQDPLLPLARWRARGQTCEIRLRDLRFSEQESHEFLSTALGDRINPAEIAALSSRTEGWVAGLQLAAISLNQAEISNANFIDSFTGDDRFVMDYLIDEVLSRQSLPVQRFLLNTSVLERISAELCAAVLDEPPDGSDSPRQILEYLERVNLFLIPLDNHREWFRYHHLFAELLQYRLKCEQGGCIPDLKRRAARWFESKNLPEEAIRYAQSAGDWQLSSALICRYSESVLNRSDYMTILRWCGNQPPATLKDNDELTQLYGYALSMTGKLEQGREMLALAQAQQTEHPARLGRTLAYASLNACFRGDFQEEIEQAARALELIPTADHSGRGSAAVSMGLGLFHLGRVAESEKAWREALAEVEHSGAERAHTNVLTYMGRLHILRGEFDQAEESYLLASGLNGLRRNLSNSEMPIFDLAQLKINQNRMEEARELAEKGLEFNRLSGSIEMRSYGFRQMVAVYQVERNWSLAQEWMDKILRLNVEFSQSPLSLSLNAACQVDLALAQGDLRAAERVAPQVTNSLGLYPFIFYPELS